MQLDLFEQLTVDSPTGIELHELLDAYVECRRNKRNTANALAFEMDYENRLIDLWQDINAHTYSPGKSIAFIVDKPVCTG